MFLNCYKMMINPTRGSYALCDNYVVTFTHTGFHLFS